MYRGPRVNIFKYVHIHTDTPSIHKYMYNNLSSGLKEKEFIKF